MVGVIPENPLSSRLNYLQSVFWVPNKMAYFVEPIALRVRNNYLLTHTEIPANTCHVVRDLEAPACRYFEGPFIAIPTKSFLIILMNIQGDRR